MENSVYEASCSPVNLRVIPLQTIKLTAPTALSYRCRLIETYGLNGAEKARVAPRSRSNPGNMKTEKVSELTTNRLSIYLRCLNELSVFQVKTISSQAMADQFNLNSAQIRKDLAYFGEFGVRGVGYYVEDLRQHLMKILGLTQKHRVAIVGLGNLGMALANYQGFNQYSFDIVALFDTDEAKIGQRVRSGLEIQSVEKLKEVIARDQIDIVILAVPATAAE